MGGIYIPNMEKPKHCTECYFACRDQCELQDNSYDYDTFKEQKKHCPLIEIDDTEWEWCHDCKEYDQESHCCHRWTKVIRKTVEELEERYGERSK